MAITFKPTPAGDEILHNGVVVGEINSGGFGFDPTGTGLVATNLQDAVSELTGKSFGIGQSLTDESTNRVAGVTYTNNTDKLILVIAYFTTPPNGTIARLYVDSDEVWTIATGATASISSCGIVPVPAGSTYSATVANGATLNRVNELSIGA